MRLVGLPSITKATLLVQCSLDSFARGNNLSISETHFHNLNTCYFECKFFPVVKRFIHCPHTPLWLLSPPKLAAPQPGCLRS